MAEAPRTLLVYLSAAPALPHDIRAAGWVNFPAMVNVVNGIDGMLRNLLSRLPGHLRHVCVEGYMVEAFIELIDIPDMHRLAALVAQEKSLRPPIYLVPTTEDFYAAKVPQSGMPAVVKRPSWRD